MSWSQPSVEFDKIAYQAGDEITGRAWIHTKKDETARKVTIRFVGRILVAWKNRKKDGHVEDHSNLKGEHIIVEMVHDVWNADDDRNIFPAGEYEWNFSFELPKDAPPSFESSLGHIRYFVEIDVDVPNTFDTTTSKPISVTSPIASPSNSHEPSRFETSTDIFCCSKIRHGNLHYSVTIAKSAYVAGEKLVGRALIENRGKKPVKGVKAQLVQQTIYRIDGDEKSKSKSKIIEKSIFVTISEVEEIVTIVPGSDTDFRFELTIPSVVATLSGTKLISVKYWIDLVADIDAMCVKNSSARCPMHIGNMPSETTTTTTPIVRFEPSVRGAADTKTWITRLREPFVPHFPVFSNLPVYKL